MNKKIPDLNHNGKFEKLMESAYGLDDKPKAPIRTRLRDLASQEGCDGEPYDTMQEASNYIEQLERKLSVMSLMQIEIDNKTKHIAYLDKKLALFKNHFKE